VITISRTSPSKRLHITARPTMLVAFVLTRRSLVADMGKNELAPE
jgi:hypothetical protein